MHVQYKYFMLRLFILYENLHSSSRKIIEITVCWHNLKDQTLYHHLKVTFMRFLSPKLSTFTTLSAHYLELIYLSWKLTMLLPLFLLE